MIRRYSDLRTTPPSGIRWRGSFWLIGGWMISFAICLLFFNSSLPGIQSFFEEPFCLQIVDRNGEELRTIPLQDGLRKVWSDEIQDYVVQAFIAAEDRTFYSHNGIDPSGVVRSIVDNLGEGRVVSGGSTITMQLSSMILRCWKRDINPITEKLLEMVYSVYLEHHYTKKEILLLWLNHLPFGRNTEGLEAGARTWFGVSANDLSPAQAVVLSVIPRSPGSYDPRRHPSRVKSAAKRITEHLPFPVTDSNIDQAIAAVRNSEPYWPFLAPHFVEFVMNSGQLTAHYGNPLTESLKPVKTTLDLTVQSRCESLIRDSVGRAEDRRLTNGAVLMIENETRAILGWVGSADFFNMKLSGQIDGVLIRRQPGSTLKPFLYGLALESGYTAADILPDIPLDFGRDEVYTPGNFTDRYHGPVRLRQALGSSLNIPAVYLAQQLGVKPFIRFLEDAGFESLQDQKDHLGLGLALGNGEVTLFELVRGFSIFANNGRYRDLNWNFNRTSDEDQILSAFNAAQVVDILSDPKARTIGFSRESVLNTAFPAMFKTGTSNQFNNIWTLGSSKDLTAGVWMGNFSGETVSGLPGSSYPAYISASLLYEFSSKQPFTKISGGERIRICSLSGLAAGSFCTSAIWETFPDSQIPERCTWHSDDSVTYPTRYREWLVQQRGVGNTRFSTEDIGIISPRDGAVFYLDPYMSTEAQVILVRVELQGDFSLFLNGTLIEQAADQLLYYWPMQSGHWIWSVESSSGRFVSEVDVH